MKKLFLLNNLYENYATGLLKKKEFESAIFKTIQENIHCFGLVGWTKEDSDDYLSSLYLRISRAINAYEETGSSFETYICALVRLTAKEYRSRQVRSYLEETAAWITQIPEMFVCENEIEYDDHTTEETESPIKLKNPRQLLILILKCCCHVSSDFLKKVSPQLGIEPETLGRMIDHLKEHREKREAEVTMLRERINRQFYRCILFQEKLRGVTEDSIAAQRLKKQLERERSRLVTARKRFMRSRLAPSNYQIAKLLGISKGTVDAVLYNLRRGALSRNKDPENLNYQENTEWPQEKTLHF